MYAEPVTDQNLVLSFRNFGDSYQISGVELIVFLSPHTQGTGLGATPIDTDKAHPNCQCFALIIALIPPSPNRQ